MAPRRTLLERMEHNPRGDWTMTDIATLARQEGIELRIPARGSHHVIVSPFLRDVLTIPQHRPIKTPYIRHVTNFVRAHRDARDHQGE